MQYDIHEYCLLNPELTPPEFQELCDSIKKIGLREPITLYQQKILKGRHRYKACEQLNIQPRFIVFSGSDADALNEVEAELYRRNITPKQRAIIASRIALIRDNSLRTIKEEAERAGASTISTFRAAKVRQEAVPELVDLMEKDERVGIGAAYEVAKLPKEEQKKVVEKFKKGEAKALKPESKPTNGKEKPKIAEKLEVAGNKKGATIDMDAFGNSVPSKLGTVFCQVESFQEAIAFVKHLQNALHDLATGAASRHIRKHLRAKKAGEAEVKFFYDGKLDDLIAILEQCTPHGAKCPSCKVAPAKGCGICGGEGWSPKATFMKQNALPKEDLDWMKARIVP